MATKNYLIFDYGGSNGRSVVARFDGTKFKMEENHRFDNRPVSVMGTLYWDILRLYSELNIGIQSSVRKYKNITSISIDTWGADFGLIDSNGKLIANPVHYRDERRAIDSESLFKIISQKELFDLTGAWVLPLFDLFHLYSLKINNATELMYGDKFLSIADIFNYFLTGNTYNEFTRFSTSILYNQSENKIEESIFDRLDLPKDIFSPIIYPGNKIGNMSDKVARSLDIDPIPVIAPATHDTASSVAGIPVTVRDKNWAFLSTGTWFALGIETEVPLISDEIFKTLFSNQAGAEKIFNFVKNINGLWVIQQCREKWIRDKEEDISWDEIVKLSVAADPLVSFIDVEEGIFSEPQTDMPEVIRDYCKKTGQPVPGSIGEIARCAYESLALKCKYYFGFLERFGSRKIESFHLVGGGTKNKVLCQWISNSTVTPVIAGPAETTSLGNLLMQLKADGEIKDLEEGRKISLISSDTNRYEPEDKELWDEAYGKYLEVLKLPA